MTPLDPLTRRLFPSLAAYARRARWAIYGCVAVVIFTAGLAAGLTIGSYRGQVADESYAHMIREFNLFKEDYLKHHVRSLTTSKAAAQVVVQQAENRRNASGNTDSN